MDCNVVIPEEIALLEEAFDIAWSVLERSGDLGQTDEASLFLTNEIASLMRNGERSRLLLSNFAIDAYRQKHPAIQLSPVQ